MPLSKKLSAGLRIFVDRPQTKLDAEASWLETSLQGGLLGSHNCCSEAVMMQVTTGSWSTDFRTISCGN